MTKNRRVTVIHTPFNHKDQFNRNLLKVELMERARRRRGNESAAIACAELRRFPSSIGVTMAWLRGWGAESGRRVS